MRSWAPFCTCANSTRRGHLGTGKEKLGGGGGRELRELQLTVTKTRRTEDVKDSRRRTQPVAGGTERPDLIRKKASKKGLGLVAGMFLGGSRFRAENSDPPHPVGKGGGAEKGKGGGFDSSRMLIGEKGGYRESEMTKQNRDQMRKRAKNDEESQF